MLGGITDPIAFLDHEGEDWAIACAVVEEAIKVKEEQRMVEAKALVKGIGIEVGNEVGRVIGAMFRMH